MSHSNKDGRSSAESEEGRPLIKETLVNLTRTRHEREARVPGADRRAESGTG